MKKILIIFALLFSVIATAQQYHDKGAKFEFATNEGDTITVNTRIPIIDEFGLINYYVDVADLLALNPAPVLEWGNITGTLSDQTDLQGALNDKADQSALTAHTSNGNIHFTQSAISITESQVSDLKDYLRGDVNDTNGSNKLTLGSLEVVGQTTLQNGLNLTSVPTGTSDNILTINGTGDVEQRVFSLGDIDIANAAGTNQFPVGLGDQLRFEGSGDTSISFDGVTNTININSTPGSGGGGAVTSFNGRDGAVVSQAGDYSTAMVNENTNLYFTEPRVRATPLTGLTVTNTPISSTNTFIQALGRLQGQINNREVSFSKNTAFNKNFGTSAGTVAQGNHTHTFASITSKPTTLSGYGITDAYTKSVSDGRYVLSNQRTDGYAWLRYGSTNPALWVTQQSTGNIVSFRQGAGDGTGVAAITNDGSYTTSGLVNAKNIFQEKTFDNYVSNTSSITESGNYKLNNGATSTPPGESLLGSSLLHLRWDDNASKQLFFSYNNDNIYYRREVSGVFTSYVKLYHSGNLRSDSQNDSRYAIMNATNTGSLTVTGDVIANSDKRLKKNIKRIDNALAIVQLLGGYEYDRKDVDLHQAGVIAQEVEEVFPVAVSEDANGTKSVAYNQLIALLIEAVKEQQIEIENLKTLINEK